MSHIMEHVPQPVLFAAGLLIVIMIYRAVASRHTPNAYQLDPRREFTKAERKTGFDRAGGRCEMSGKFPFTRCRRAAQHGDHHYPWSKGGASNLGNFVAACAPCNLSKSDKIPTMLQTRAITRRRRRYFPTHTPTTTGARYGRL